MKLSVVVPVYNVERYLAQCLDSLFAQTRPVEEIIAVDDSDDSSSAILSSYASSRAVLRVVRGPGKDVNAARNLGVQLASGEWLAFVDADDFVDPPRFERLLSLAERHSADMVVGNGRYHYEGAKPDRPIYVDHPPAGPMPGAEWLARKLEARSFLHAVWMHVYRRDFLLANGMRFPDGVLHEDVVWTTRALVAARTIAYDDAPLYAYRAAAPARAPDPVTSGDAAAERSAGTRTMAYVLRNRDRFSAAAIDERTKRVIEGAKFNATTLAYIAAQCGESSVARAIRWQLVDGGLSVFHKIRQLSDPALRRDEWRKTRRDGFLALLWRNAVDARQRRKIAARYLRTVLAGGFTWSAKRAGPGA